MSWATESKPEAEVTRSDFWMQFFCFLEKGKEKEVRTGEMDNGQSRSSGGRQSGLARARGGYAVQVILYIEKAL